MRDGKIEEDRFWMPPRNSEVDVPVNIPAMIHFHRRHRMRRDVSNLFNLKRTVLPQSFIQPLPPVIVANSPLGNKNPRTKVSLPEVLNMVDFKTRVDVCFLVDVSEHMATAMPLVQQNIQTVLSIISTNNAIGQWRVAFVGYRDFEDTPNQFEELDFTRNSGKFLLFLKKISPSGGGLEPNDVFGGISKALEKDWRQGNQTNLIIHMTNSPTHGCDTHKMKSDDFPMGDPESRTAVSLFNAMKNKNILYVFGKISDDTDTMVDLFDTANDSPILTFDVDAN